MQPSPPAEAHVVVRLDELYPAAEAAYPLAYRRVLGIARLATRIAREMTIPHDLAILLATILVAPVAHA